MSIVAKRSPILATAEPLFVQLTLLPNPKCLCLQCFSIGQTPKVPLPTEAYTFPCNTCFLDPPGSAFQTTSRLIQPFLHSSQQWVPILYNVHWNAIHRSSGIQRINDFSQVVAAYQKFSSSITARVAWNINKMSCVSYFIFTITFNRKDCLRLMLVTKLPNW